MKPYYIFILLISATVISHGQEKPYTVDALVNPVIPGKIITVGGDNSDIPGYTNNAIQYAVNSLGKSGGTIILSTGTYDIGAPVSLKSNVQLVGSGKETILRKSKGVQTEYIVDADYGELKLTVKNPDGFYPGMKVQVTDSENSSCWNVSTAYITEIVDNVIYIDNYLIRDYRSDLDGKISNASSVIEIIEAENVEVLNLTVDGNKKENFLTDGCNGSGIYIFKSKIVTIDNVVVKNFNGEGISWQITENVTVKNSEISGSGNIGLHPATGSPLSVIENNNVHDNEVDGLFICWRVHHSRVTGNRFYNNGRYGICTGHKDTDVIFEGNHIYDNNSDGIHLRGERAPNAPHRNSFIDNIIENNGRKNGGYGISFNSPAEDVVLIGNTIRDTGPGTQKAGLFFYPNALPVKIQDNNFSGHEMGDKAFEEEEGK
jgi:nitrous oxidase accessory protein NosD